MFFVFEIRCYSNTVSYLECFGESEVHYNYLFLCCTTLTICGNDGMWGYFDRNLFDLNSLVHTATANVIVSMLVKKPHTELLLSKILGERRRVDLLESRE